MPVHRNATRATEAPADRLIRTGYTLVVRVACGHQPVHTPLHQPSGPECGASAHRTFTLLRDLREDR
jgi:hypothetical protein